MRLRAIVRVTLIRLHVLLSSYTFLTRKSNRWINSRLLKSRCTSEGFPVIHGEIEFHQRMLKKSLRVYWRPWLEASSYTNASWYTFFFLCALRKRSKAGWRKDVTYFSSSPVCSRGKIELGAIWKKAPEKFRWARGGSSGGSWAWISRIHPFFFISVYGTSGGEALFFLSIFWNFVGAGCFRDFFGGDFSRVQCQEGWDFFHYKRDKGGKKVINRRLSAELLKNFTDDLIFWLQGISLQPLFNVYRNRILIKKLLLT